MKNSFSLIKVAVFVLALAGLFIFIRADAQVRVKVGGPAVTQPAGWTRCGSEGQECIFSGTRSVRYGSHVVNKWSTPKDLPSPVKCANSTFGDPAPEYVKQCELADVVTATLAASWSAPEGNTDGSQLAGPLGYRVERAPSETGPWAAWASVGITSASGQVSYGKNCIRVFALVAEIESEPSEVVCVVKAAPILKPGAPTKVKAQ